MVLDHADGEVARLTLTESVLGEWLDVVVDTVVHTTLMLALGVAAAALAGGGLPAGVVAAVGIGRQRLLGKIWPPAPADAPRAPARPPHLARRLLRHAPLFVVLGLSRPALLPGLIRRAGRHSPSTGSREPSSSSSAAA